MCVSLCAVYTLATLVLWDTLKSWASVCVWVCVKIWPKRAEPDPHITYWYFRSCRSWNIIQRTWKILELYFLFPNSNLLSLTTIYTHTHSHSPCSLTHTHMHPVRLLAKSQEAATSHRCQTRLYIMFFDLLSKKSEGLKAAQSHHVEMEEGWSLPPCEETRKRRVAKQSALDRAPCF